MSLDTLALQLDDFCTWLCERETEIVGHTGIWFSDPLSEWLSSLTGHLYGVEGKVSGPAFVDSCRWQYLPMWAQLLALRMEIMLKRTVTGGEVLGLLADIELRVNGFR